MTSRRSTAPSLAPATLASPPADPAAPPLLTGWRRLWTRPALMVYVRLLVLVVAANIAVAAVALPGTTTPERLGLTLTAAALNLGLAALIRQQHVVNFLFRAATSAPLSWPLRVRAALGKVYHLGGVHVGAAISATAWFAVFAATALSPGGRSGLSGATLGVIAALALLLAMIAALAVAPLRRGRHDVFEMSHRFGGWLTLILFAVLTVGFARDLAPEDPGHAILTSPATWVLLVVVVSVALPWARLRRVAVDVHTPSSHVALVRLHHSPRTFVGSSTTISRHPLGQWHPFANLVTPTRPELRLAISRAGDWTGSFIDSPPRHVWVRGVPTAGAGNVGKLFRKVVWVTTGSGIGPCLPSLLAGAPAHLVWATRTPEATFGPELVAEITTSLPDALVWDTHAQGKPDLVALALDAVAATGAEAVICISNRPTTFEVVEALESRGIPAYGAIWDS
ncbi:ferredoxin reductase domain-containing protein [Oerskovia turbata]